MKKLMKMGISGCMAVITAASLFTVPGVRAEAARTITIDGDPSEWDGIPVNKSTDSKIAKWSVCKDDDYVYFYVQQNGGNVYGQPITDTNFVIKYEDGSSDGIRFTYNMGGITNGVNNPIDGVTDKDKASEPSDEKDKYETEFRIPAKFFGDKSYVLEYCGSKVDSKDITDLSTMEETVKKDEYSGITIDGNFKDWNAVEKKDVTGNSEKNNYISKAAVVFDGDRIYIYLKETSDGAALASGSYSRGAYELITDTGRRTTLKLVKENGEYKVNVNEYTEHQMKNESIEVEHSNLQYEISVPVSALKQYNKSFSFGYYLADEPLISDIVNKKSDSSYGSLDKDFDGIKYDGSYSDWDNYAHSTIEYSTQGGQTEDAEAALYASDGYLYGHVKSFLHKNSDGRNEFLPFTIRANKNEKTSIQFRAVEVSKSGNINWSPKLTDLSEGNHEFTLVDIGSWTTYENISDDGFISYGNIIITSGSKYDEMEYKVDMSKLAKKFDLDENEMKVLQAQYINIGDEWITYAGTSTGPIVGVTLCCLTVVGVLSYKKRKEKVEVQTA